MPITFQGAPVTLCGPRLRPGDVMPDFSLTDPSLHTVRASELKGVRLFLTVPSLDTGVCDQEVRRFGEAAAQIPGVTVCAVSQDLPFAQARWRNAAGGQAVCTLSDYKDHSFGKATGTEIEELGLLARAVFVVDSSDKIAYTEYVSEITRHPGYAAALDTLESLALLS